MRPGKSMAPQVERVNRNPLHPTLFCHVKRSECEWTKIARTAHADCARWAWQTSLTLSGWQPSVSTEKSEIPGAALYVRNPPLAFFWLGFRKPKPLSPWLLQCFNLPSDHGIGFASKRANSPQTGQAIALVMICPFQMSLECNAAKFDSPSGRLSFHPSWKPTLRFGAPHCGSLRSVSDPDLHRPGRRSLRPNLCPAGHSSFVSSYKSTSISHKPQSHQMIWSQPHHLSSNAGSPGMTIELAAVAPTRPAIACSGRKRTQTFAPSSLVQMKHRAATFAEWAPKCWSALTGQKRAKSSCSPSSSHSPRGRCCRCWCWWLRPYRVSAGSYASVTLQPFAALRSPVTKQRQSRPLRIVTSLASSRRSWRRRHSRHAQWSARERSVVADRGVRRLPRTMWSRSRCRVPDTSGQSRTWSNSTWFQE